MMLKTDPIDLKFDPTTGELVVTDNIQLSSGVDGVAQSIRQRLQLFQGEWFLNLEEGTPYFTEILGAKFNEAKIRGAIRPVILAAPGVTELLSLAVAFDGATRNLSVSWEVKTVFDDTVADTLNVTV